MASSKKNDTGAKLQRTHRHTDRTICSHEYHTPGDVGIRMIDLFVCAFLLSASPPDTCYTTYQSQTMTQRKHCKGSTKMIFIPEHRNEPRGETQALRAAHNTVYNIPLYNTHSQSFRTICQLSIVTAGSEARPTCQKRSDRPRKATTAGFQPIRPRRCKHPSLGEHLLEVSRPGRNYESSRVLCT